MAAYTTTYTLIQYEALSAAIAQGALQVRYGDKMVTYRSLDEMIRIKSIIAGELGINTGKRGRTFMSFTKGLQ